MNIVTFRAFRATDIEFINHHDSGVRIEFKIPILITSNTPRITTA